MKASGRNSIQTTLEHALPLGVREGIQTVCVFTVPGFAGTQSASRT